MLEKLREVKNVQEALSILLNAENALAYNKIDLMNRYVENCPEDNALALELSGTSGEYMVLGFIREGKFIESFLENVSYNSSRSIPLVVRAINLHCINQKN
jgi:hypothetical protein